MGTLKRPRKPRREPWPGGYIHTQKDGRKLFIIEREVGGQDGTRQRFHVSTRCHDWRSAMAQLARFEAEPLSYRPEGATREAPLLLTNELVEAFEAYSLEVRGNTPAYAAATTRRLYDWMEDLGRLDLRKATLRDHIAPALERRKKSRQHRIIALKALYGWLRKVRHTLTSAQDPTLDLPVPQARPEKHVRRKAVDRAVVLKAFKHLAPAYRDVLQLLATTGWHVTELERFVRSKEAELVTPPKKSVDRRGRAILAVLVTRHKTGSLTRTPIVGPKAAAAARRLKERGSMPRRLNETLARACAAADVPVFTSGVMRHSVATWAVEAGDDPAAVAEYLDHHDKSTTLRFYADVAVPTVTVSTSDL